MGTLKLWKVRADGGRERLRLYAAAAYEPGVSQVNPGLLYFLLAFSACVGTLQLACDLGGLRLALFFRRRRYTRLLSAALLLPSLAVLFLWNSFLPVAIVEGLEQALLFSAGGLVAILFVFVVSSIVNRKASVPNASGEGGLGKLRLMTYYQALKKRNRGSSNKP